MDNWQPANVPENEEEENYNFRFRRMSMTSKQLPFYVLRLPRIDDKALYGFCAICLIRHLIYLPQRRHGS